MLVQRHDTDGLVALQALSLVGEPWEIEIVPRLPATRAEQARALKAFQRARGQQLVSRRASLVCTACSAVGYGVGDLRNLRGEPGWNSVQVHALTDRNRRQEEGGRHEERAVSSRLWACASPRSDDTRCRGTQPACRGAPQCGGHSPSGEVTGSRQTLTADA